jgi:hypothetical protein
MPSKLKKIVRDRMAKTGEGYHTALRIVRAQAPLHHPEVGRGPAAPEERNVPSGDVAAEAAVPKAISYTFTVSVGAAIKRINRELAADNMKLVKLRGRKAEEYGDFVVIDRPNVSDVVGWGMHGPLHSRIEQHNVDLTKLGRELGVLREWETVAQ